MPLDTRNLDLTANVPPVWYQVCTHCIMDTTDPDITFDDEGVCDHCRRYNEIAQTHLFTGEVGRRQLEAIVARIKADGAGRDYDSIVGVSGGVDSSYVAYQARRLGLRPLAVHMDNGWNSELAVHNIERVLKYLNIDLHTQVLDWEEFKDIQMAFLKASTPDSEIPTDHAHRAVCYRLADRLNIKYILSGHNVVSETIMPLAWSYDNNDLYHLKAIHGRSGTRRMKSFPTLSLARRQYYTHVKMIHSVRILNYLDYDLEKAIDLLINELGWEYYGGKHYESVYTRFFQGYILPVKFGFDKRRPHYSSLICAGQMTRDEALAAIQQQSYPSELLSEDMDLVLSKFGLTGKEFDTIMKAERKSFRDYPNSYKVRRFLSRTKALLLSRQSLPAR